MSDTGATSKRFVAPDSRRDRAAAPDSRCGRATALLALLLLTTIAVAATVAACGSATKPRAATLAATGTAVSADATALLRVSAAAMDTKVKTASFSMKMSSNTTLNGTASTTSMNIAGDIADNGDSIRGKGTVTIAGARTVGVELIGVTSGGRLVAYLRVAGVPGWKQLPPDQSDIATTSAQDIEAILSAAQRLQIVRKETVSGVLCDVVQVDLDVVAYDKASKNLGLADSVSKELHISQADAVSELQNATGTELLWIGRDDHLEYRETRDYVVDAGSQGKYEEGGSMDVSDFGKVVDPPITAPLVSPTTI
jgi:hypothetical protein